MDDELSASWLTVNEVGNGLKSILEKDFGSNPDYQLCKDLYLYHPLGAKMAEAPVRLSQSQERNISVAEAPDEVVKAFREEWERLSADRHIFNVKRLARVYGISSIVLGCEQVDSDQPIEMDRLSQLDIWFNVFDPLNTAGSLVLNQVPNAADFNKPPGTVVVNGKAYHRSRQQVVMNEEPIYLAYTASAFGFVGRSVYQRALFPLKSFIRSMIADDMISTKLGLLIAKQEQPGSIINKMMSKVADLKRSLLKQAKTGNVLHIGKDEDIATLNMQNVDGAGKYSRTNILKNVATAADMPAVLIENETMVEGFGEGTEDAKNIARYIDAFRREMAPLYCWFDNICQYRAWNPQFYSAIQKKYPQTYGNRNYEDAFSEWRENFVATWPNLLIEPDSEKMKVEQTKLESLTAFMQTLMNTLDPANKAKLIQWATDNASENRMLFPHALDLDFEGLETFLETQPQPGEEGEEGGTEDVGPMGRKFGRFG